MDMAVNKQAIIQAVEGRMLGVVGDVAEVEARLLQHLQLVVGLDRRQVRRARMQGDLAFVAAQLLDAHRRVDVDGEHQVLELHVLRRPVVLVALVADLRVLLVALEHERAGADRLLVDVAGAALGQQVIGVLGGEDGGEAHGQVLDERGVDAVEGEYHGQRVGLLDLGDVLVQAHADEVGKLGRVGRAEWVVLVEHAVEGEQHIIGVEVAAWGEGLVAVELHPFAQMEGVAQAVFGDLPAGRQGGLDSGAATFELDQAVVDRFGGIVVGGAGVLGGVEAGGAAFGAEHQVLGEQGRGLGHQAEAEQGAEECGVAHGESFFRLFSPQWVESRQQGSCPDAGGIGRARLQIAFVALGTAAGHQPAAQGLALFLHAHAVEGVQAEGLILKSFTLALIGW